MEKTVGLIATGSELISGEVANSNSQQFAQMLAAAGIDVGHHITVDDSHNNIVMALQLQLKHNAAVIVCGGLGPTRDDITRNAVAEVVQQPLQLHQPSWDYIQTRLQSRSLPISAGNKQQAYFPKGATILKNENGTAPAAVINYQQKLIIMVPGPPRECMPIMERDVVPLLQQHGFATDKKLFRWRMLGVTEAAIAEEIETALSDFKVETIYLYHYPYIDFKLLLTTAQQTPQLFAAVEKVIAEHVVATADISASELLVQQLQQQQVELIIIDELTGGALQNLLQIPELLQQVKFVTAATAATIKESGNNQIIVHAHGLECYWQGKECPKLVNFNVEIIAKNNSKQHYQHKIIYRKQYIKQAVLEYVSNDILQGL